MKFHMPVRLLFISIALQFIVFSLNTPCFADDALKYFEMGNKYSKEGKYELAIKEYQKAIKNNQRISAFHYNLANVLFAVERRKEAIKEYKKAISINPLNSDYNRNLGIAYTMEGQFNEAEEILKNLQIASPAKAKQLESFLAVSKKQKIQK